MIYNKHEQTRNTKYGLETRDVYTFMYCLVGLMKGVLAYVRHPFTLLMEKSFV
jgi:hypothetical protein